MGNDYVFWTSGIVLCEDAMTEREAKAKAQELARMRKQAISYGLVLRYSVLPEICPVCNEVMPVDGICPCQDEE